MSKSTSAMAHPSPSTSSAATGTAAGSLSTETLLNLLECPVCLDPCIPPIYACSIGHKICKGCSPNIHRCPVCRSGYMGTRDFVAEELYAKLKEAGLLQSLEDTEPENDNEEPIECHLGALSETLLMQCSLGALTNLPRFECYITHLIHRHKVGHETLQLEVPLRKRIYYRNGTFVRNGASKLLVLKCSDQTFLLVLNKTGDNVWIYVAAALAKIAREFTIELEIPMANDENVLLAQNVSKDIYSIKEDPANIYKNATCLVANENMLNENGCKRIPKGGRCLELKITIKLRLEKKMPPTPTSTGATARISPQRSRLIAELPHFDDDADTDDLGDQILGLQSQVRDFRIGLMNRIQSASRNETPTRGSSSRPGIGISQLSPEPATNDGSIRNRTLLYRSPGTSNLPADSAEPEPRSVLALRERSLGRLREHRDMVLELRRLREQREALERRERDGRSYPSRIDRRPLRRTSATSVITSRDFFADSDEENEYIDRLCREANGSQEERPSALSDPVSPTRPLRYPRRAFSARVGADPPIVSSTSSSGISDADQSHPRGLRYLLAQQRRATSPDTAARPRGDFSTSPDSSCVIS